MRGFLWDPPRVPTYYNFAWVPHTFGEVWPLLTSLISHTESKCRDTQPSSLPDIRRVFTIKILSVTISNKLSVNDHVSNIVSKCSQILYALTILRAHGLCHTALQAVFRSVVITRLLYACSAWWGYASSSDRPQIAAFIHWGVRQTI